MARKLPCGQQVMTGVKPGGMDVVAEDMMMETNTPKAKGVFAIMPTLFAAGSGNTDPRVGNVGEFQLNLHSDTIAPSA